MLTDCDMLSRCNTWTNEWRKDEETNRKRKEQQQKEETISNKDSNTLTAPADISQAKTTVTTQPFALLALISADPGRGDKAEPLPIPRTHINPRVVRENVINRTLLARTCDRVRTLWILGTGAETATTAMTNLGLESLLVGSTDEEYWRTYCDVPDLATFVSRLEKKHAHEA